MNGYIYAIRSDLIELVTGKYLPEDRKKFMDRINSRLDEFEKENKELRKALGLAVDMIEENFTPECERGWMDKQERLDYFIEQAQAKLKEKSND